MDKELAQTYDHNQIEEQIYSWWEENEYFRPETQRKLGLVDDNSPRFCITIPLPNVTGILHIGHALVISLEDLMTRYARMNQKETLYIPGTDHAGIATQNVVERELLKQGIKRKEIGREKFVEKVWEWKKKYHARITEQSKSMGISCDWEREHFTLDPQLTRAVRETFYRLYQKGLIYRGEYMVNWCPRCESAISDLETEAKDVEGRFWYIKYPIKTAKWDGPKHEWGSGRWAEGAEDYIIVATTRPETLLGDTAIATHEKHPEYGSWIGKTAILPAVGRKIKLISDQHVDPEFGTGAVKITPAHDPDDFEVGQRHNLEFINIFDINAKILPGFNDNYTGLDRYICRDEIVQDLEKEDLIVKIEDMSHAVGHCQRCHTTIEPRISIQWFVKTKPLADAAIKKVEAGETEILPDREEDRFYFWMKNIRDWCISRQLWWGHQIPIWYCDNCNAEICPEPNVDEISTCPECGSSSVHQDEDVLDTWFSSGLWTFATLGWPDTNHPDYKRFFPTDMRETGYDILFFWVAREMMLGIEMTKQVPFTQVYLHGLIRDAHGQKISKSMENIADYDPLKIIGKYGADSLRYVLISNSVPGMDTNLDPRTLDAAHRFCNKIWQASRYVLMNITGDDIVPSFESIKDKKLKYADRWILSRLNHTVKIVTEAYESYDYLTAGREIKNFFWKEFCDWYIEMSKIRIYADNSDTDETIPKTILLHVLQTCLRIMHPIMPFLTEELWQALPENFKDADAIIIAQWPSVMEKYIDEKIEANFDIVSDFIREIRRVKHDFNISLNQNVPLTIELHDNMNYFKPAMEVFVALGNIKKDELNIVQEIDPPKQAARIVSHGITGYIQLKGVVDLQQEVGKLKKEMEKIEGIIEKRQKKLNSPFAERAPAEIVAEERKKLSEEQDQKQQLREQIQMLSE